MQLIYAIGNLVYLGYDYYNIGKVILFEYIGEVQFKGFVEGSTDKPYEVFIDINYLKKSHCN